MTSKDIPSKASQATSGDYDKPAPGETDLTALLCTLDPILDPVPYIWVSLPPGETPPPTLTSSILFQFAEPYYPGSEHDNPLPSAGLAAQSASAPKTRMTFVLSKPALNSFSTTTIRLGINDDTLGLANGTETAFPCRMITCRVQSSLSAVGMMAKITEELAAEGISCNPVSAFFHDYLFVKEEDAELAMDVLLDIVDDAKEDAGLPLDDDDEDDEEDYEDDDNDDYDDEEDDDGEEEEDKEVTEAQRKMQKTTVKDKAKGK